MRKNSGFIGRREIAKILHSSPHENGDEKYELVLTKEIVGGRCRRFAIEKNGKSFVFFEFLRKYPKLYVN